jgi:hypothetical protein
MRFVFRVGFEEAGLRLARVPRLGEDEVGDRRERGAALLVRAAEPLGDDVAAIESGRPSPGFVGRADPRRDSTSKTSSQQALAMTSSMSPEGISKARLSFASIPSRAPSACIAEGSRAQHMR